MALFGPVLRSLGANRLASAQILASVLGPHNSTSTLRRGSANWLATASRSSRRLPHPNREARLPLATCIFRLNHLRSERPPRAAGTPIAF
jgi:hypothetical protein